MRVKELRSGMVPPDPVGTPVARVLQAALWASGSCRSVPRRVAAGGRVIERVTKVSKVKTATCRRCDIYGSAGIRAVNWRGHMRSGGPALWLFLTEGCLEQKSNCCMVKAFHEWLLINACEGGGRGKYEEESALSVARSTADRTLSLLAEAQQQRPRTKRSAGAHQLYVLAVSPARLG